MTHRLPPMWSVECLQRGAWVALGYWPLGTRGEREARKYAAANRALGHVTRVRIDMGESAAGRAQEG